MSSQRGVLELDDYLTGLHTERELFVAAIAAAEPDAPIPNCPEWTMRDLVHHQGQVHRWAAVIVADQIAKPSAVPQDYLGPVPSDGELADWLGTGIDELIAVLRVADPDVQCFTFLADPPRPLLFWARRQLHETGIHRVDAQPAVGDISAFSAFSAPVAADGIDELMTGFVPRKHTPLHSDPPVSLTVEPDDAPGFWQTTISDAPPVTVCLPIDADRPKADCTLAGSASDIYTALWNRRGLERLSITGDAALIELFRSSVHIRWS